MRRSASVSREAGCEARASSAEGRDLAGMAGYHENSPARGTKRGLGLTTLLAVLAICPAGCDEAPAAAAATAGPEPRILGGPEAPAGLGAIATAPDYQMTVETVEDCILPAPFQAADGKRKLSVDVVLEGTSDREVPVNPFYAHIEDGEGDRFEATLAGCKPVLAAERVTSGHKARGLLTFELPQSVRRLRLIYAPVVIGGGREELRFDLGM